MKKYMSKFKNYYANINHKLRILTLKIQQKPLTAFYVFLGILVLLIVLQNFVNKPAQAPEAEVIPPKKVPTFVIGESPALELFGKVSKSGVVKITALTGGVVQKIHFNEGAFVKKGSVIVQLASNYQNGNIAKTQVQLASIQLDQINKNYDSQKDVISKQKEIAEKSQSQVANMRAITKESISETEKLIELNGQIIASLDKNLATLSLDPIANEALILQTKQVKSQFLSAQNMANNANRVAKFQADSESDPNKIAILTQEIAIKQLDMQSAMLDNQKEMAKLQLQIAQIQAGMMSPASPFAGRIQKIAVKEGEVIGPGTLIAIVSQTKDDPITLTALLNRDSAKMIAQNEYAQIFIQDEVLQIKSKYVSADAVENGLFAVYFQIPEKYLDKVTDEEQLRIRLPLVSNDITSSNVFLPLDGIHQTSTSAYVYLFVDGKAIATQVKLGQVVGSMVEVDGLKIGDKVVLDRSVVSEMKIEEI